MGRSATSIILCAGFAWAACTPSFRESAEQAARDLDQRWIEARLLRLASNELEGRDNLSAGGRRARRFLIEQLDAIGLAPRGPSDWEQPFDQGVNVLAQIRGRDPAVADEYVLLGAHYDHLGRCGDGLREICPGAVDNAAGVAAVLAVARGLATSAAGTRRSILVALWDGEEDGLLGSRLYVQQQPVVPLARLTAVVNVDTVGGTLIPGVQSSFALGTEYASDELRALIHANNAPSSYEMFPVSSFFDGNEEDGGRSDHLPFRESEIPSVWYSSGAPPEYHTPADAPEIVDLPKLLGTARHALLVTADLANADAPPRFAPRRPHLDDALALGAIGEIVLADPAAAGFGDSTVVTAVLRQWLDRLRAYVEAPPSTAMEWEEYDQFIRSIIRTVFAMLPGIR